MARESMMPGGTLYGQMMDYPLTLPSILQRARTVFPEKEIVSRLEDESLHRTTYAALYPRVLRLMDALRSLGVRPGDRVATFAWNGYRHLELYFAVPCMGAVLHTVNVRLTPRQLDYIVGHAGDTWIFADRCLVESLAPLVRGRKTEGLRGVVVMDDAGAGAVAGLEGALDYETLMDAAAERDAFPDIDENQAAGLCYTSGTTGEPKGVLYSHRAYYLHSLGGGMVDSMAVSQRETVMPVVPMFHANAWGFPFTSAMTGAKLVLPGMHMTGAHLADLIERERVSLAAGVPTIWNLMLQSVRRTPRDLSSLKSMIVGGSAVPRALIQAYRDELGVEITQAWGMTETTPVGCCTRLKTATLAGSADEQLDARAKQGVAVPGIEACVVDDDGRDLPWDGQSIGELCVRGPWVAGSYFGDESLTSAFFEDDEGRQWFRTGDVATIDALGYIEITDRKKDLIKSRGEWISSVELENAAMSHTGVLEAAVTGRPDELRGEVPVLWFVAQPPEDGEDGDEAGEANASTPSADELIEHLGAQFERWQLPRRADVHRIDAIPKTSVGKFDKKVLRARLAAQSASDAPQPVGD
jgi:fatty-acyl-CoA synthase